VTERELQDLKKIIYITGEYYSKTLIAEVVQMRASDLHDLEYEEVRKAYEMYRRDPKNRFDPLPSQIREICRPVVSDESLAREVTGKIWYALSHFGYTDPEGARKHIGELGWTVIGHEWKRLCESPTNRGQFIAQTRDAVMAKIELAKAGKLNQPIGIPERRDRNAPLTAKFSDLVKIGIKDVEV
jgi:hypothetical protein